MPDTGSRASPGGQASNSPQAARATLVRVLLALINLRSRDLRGHNHNPRPASPGSTIEVETDHPLWNCQPDVARTTCSARPYTDNTEAPTQIPATPTGPEPNRPVSLKHRPMCRLRSMGRGLA